MTNIYIYISVFSILLLPRDLSSKWFFSPIHFFEKTGTKIMSTKKDGSYSIELKVTLTVEGNKIKGKAEILSSCTEEEVNKLTSLLKEHNSSLKIEKTV